MAEYTYEQLHKMTVGELREIAAPIEDERVKGFSQLHKEQILPILCEVLGIEARAHHVAVGIDKAPIKQEIRSLKAKRDALISAKSTEARKELRGVRRKLRKQRRKLRRAMT
jgi:hypothetical protein